MFAGCYLITSSEIMILHTRVCVVVGDVLGENVKEAAQVDLIPYIFYYTDYLSSTLVDVDN